MEGNQALPVASTKLLDANRSDLPSTEWRPQTPTPMLVLVEQLQNANAKPCNNVPLESGSEMPKSPTPVLALVEQSQNAKPCDAPSESESPASASGTNRSRINMNYSSCDVPPGSGSTPLTPVSAESKQPEPVFPVVLSNVPQPSRSMSQSPPLLMPNIVRINLRTPSPSTSTAVKAPRKNKRAQPNKPRLFLDSGVAGKKEIRWTKLSARAKQDSIIPSPRHGHRALLLGNNQVMVFGGGNEGLFSGLNILDVEKMEWSQPKIGGDPPPLVANFGAVYDNSSSDESMHRILVFGGMEEANIYSNSLYELKYNAKEDVWEWRRLNPLPTRDPKRPYPVPRHGHSFTIVKDKVYLFGGMANMAAFYPEFRNDQFSPFYLNDMFVLNLSLNYPDGVWDAPVTFGFPPTPRESHSAAVYSNASCNKIIIFGGMAHGFRLDDLIVLDVDSMFWSQSMFRIPHTPSACSLHSASIVGNKMYIFGGWNEQDQYVRHLDPVNIKKNFMVVNTVSCLNIETMAWELVKPVGTEPAARAGHCAFTLDGRIYIWSGRDGYAKNRGRQVCHNDMWRLDVEPPAAPGKCRMVRDQPNSLSIAWDPVPGADSYILQCVAIK